MESNDYRECVLYVGRFQPPHIGHMTIFNESINAGKRICIAIRNMEPSEQNPLKADIVKRLWEMIYAGNELVEVIIVPNICSIKYGRNVGYSIDEIKVDGSVSMISATDIRNSIRVNDESWKKNVSSIIHKELEFYLKQ